MSKSKLTKGIALSSTLALALAAMPASAEIDFGSLGEFASDADNSPVPTGFVLGGVLIGGQSRYEAQDNSYYAIPGFIYFGDRVMYLGDRARYYFYKEGNVSSYLYGRVRFGNLDPKDEDEFAGMDKREWEFEAGIGANIVTPYALLTIRAAGDVTGTSKGGEVLFWADFPIIQDNLLVMPGLGVMVRSDNLANYYFGGVSRSEARADRPEWDTGTTVSPMAALITSYRFNKKWIGMAAVNYEFYDSDIKDSPLVQHDGELYAGIGVGYIW